MNFNYRHLLNPDFHPNSRVWIYQSSRIFSISEALEIEAMLVNFTGAWLSHGIPVKGAAYLFFGQFIVLMADETAAGVSGCSTDSSVRVIKEIEQRFGVNMFDRTMLAFIINDRVEMLPMAQLQYAFANGFITGDTLYFNNVVQTRDQLESHWLVPLKDSWLARRISFTNSVS